MSRISRGGIAVSFMAAALSGCVKAGPPGSAMMSPPAQSAASQSVETQPLSDSDSAANPAAKAKSGAVAVAAGDTLYSIARKNGVSIRDLITWNGLDAPYQLRPGQVLRLPPKLEHVVSSGDTVYSISRQHGADMTALVRANGIEPPYAIRAGQRLKIPTESMPALAAAPAPAASPAGESVTSAVTDPTGTAVITLPLPPLEGAPAAGAPEAGDLETQQTAALPAAPLPAQSGSGFLWPVRGKILSSFGAKKGGQHNDGINIETRRGEPVQAAADGSVIYAGNELRGFGNLVLVKHDGGWTTAYAHNERLLVKKGDSVARGQTIAKAGSSGSVATPQVHFELRRGTRAVNPADYLGAATTISAK